jgi:integrase/recombinase XerC
VALLGVSGPRDRALVLLLAHGGLRAMEALQLQWADVDLGRGVLVVREGKGGKTAGVNMSGRLVGALRELREVNTEEGGEVIGGSQPGAWKRLKRLADRAGVRFLGLHSFRHYAGTRLASQTDGNLEAVARHLRHSQLETARTYAKMSDERVRRAVADW